MNWETAKKIVVARDGGLCLKCLGQADVVHHRRVRGMGGSGDPAITTGLANLISLCSACHLEVHLHPEVSYESGFLVRMGMNPEEVPIILKLMIVRLSSDGDIIRSGEHALF